MLRIFNIMLMKYSEGKTWPFIIAGKENTLTHRGDQLINCDLLTCLICLYIFEKKMYFKNYV